MKLEFGTAGIRGIVGNDDNNLNNAHAARIFEGFARYLLKKFKNEKILIVVGRDNRKKGKDFVNLASNILTSHGIKVCLSSSMMPTPFISFLVKNKKAHGAINITASHNPKEYNGIKIYNEFGYQMLPNEINDLISNFDEYEKYKEYNFKEKIKLQENNLISFYNEEDFNKYINQIIKKINVNNIDLSNLVVVYSSMHGTGYKFLKKIFDLTNIKVSYELNEIIEDENFSYVENPNPESEIAYKNVMKIAKEKNADIILVTDPDSDRVGVACKWKDTYKLINGNEFAILVTDFLLNNNEINNKESNYLIHSFVSTSLPSKMVSTKGIKTKVTETGFKWIGHQIKQMKHNEKLFFAFEESYGSLINDSLSLDKDAIQSAYAILLVASLAKKGNITIYEKLKTIYEQYGFLQAKSFSYDLDKNTDNQMLKIKERFKKINFKDAKLIDYSQGIRNIEPNDMLCYEFDDSINWVSLRASGTEPKFKIYIHVVEKTEEQSKSKFDELVKIINEKILL